MEKEFSNDSARQCSNELVNHHRVLLEAMRAREGEILKFLGFMLPAIGGFAWLLTRTPDNVSLVGATVGVLCVQFVLWWGGRYALALSYNYRCLQAQIKKFEICMGTDKAMLNEWQGVPTPIHNDAEFPPEIFKTQLTAFFVGQALVSVGGIIFIVSASPLICKQAGSLYECPLLGTVTLAGAAVIFVGELFWRRHQLWHKHRDLLDAERSDRG